MPAKKVQKKALGGALSAALPTLPRVAATQRSVKGLPLSPVTAAKRNNGIPGLKKGGKSK